MTAQEQPHGRIKVALLLLGAVLSALGAQTATAGAGAPAAARSAAIAG